MASVILESLGWGSVTSVTSVTPFLHYVCPRFAAGPLAPLCCLVFVFCLPPSASEALGRPLTERSKTHRPSDFVRRCRREVSNGAYGDAPREQH